MKLVKNARSVWRFYSTWMTAAILAVPYAWDQLPRDLKATVPDSAMPWISMTVFFVWVFARTKPQGDES